MHRIYFSRFVQLIYNHVCSGTEKPESERVEPFRLTKRAFSDLDANNSKRTEFIGLRIPRVVRQHLVKALLDVYSSHFRLRAMS